MVNAERVARNADSGLFEVNTPEGIIESKTVIVCGGASPRKAGFEGEQQFTGHGVSYYATCDGMFYRGKKVYVIGGGNSAAEEALFLTRFAAQVDVIVRKDHLRAQAAVGQELADNPKVNIRYLTSIVGVEGNTMLTSVTVRDNTTGETHEETYDEGGFGVFVFVGRVPASELLSGMVEVDEAGYVIADEWMATSTPGLFVAGDLRRKPLRQIVTAASDGAIAATAASAFLGHPVEG
jgi:thioredoxin reductase (NADPH)